MSLFKYMFVVYSSSTLNVRHRDIYKILHGMDILYQFLTILTASNQAIFI
jgi:hypothetical protein